MNAYIQSVAAASTSAVAATQATCEAIAALRSSGTINDDAVAQALADKASANAAAVAELDAKIQQKAAQ